MRFDRATRTCTSWVAILAILLGLFAPAISQALASNASPSWVELCSASGINWVKASDVGNTSAPSPSHQAHSYEHCPYCSLHADVVPVLPTLPRLALPLALSEAAPAAFLAATRTLHAWVQAQPRAPPSQA